MNTAKTKHLEYLENVLIGKQVTKEVYIEGKGKATAYGELNFEGLLKRLLKSKYITG